MKSGRFIVALAVIFLSQAIGYAQSPALPPLDPGALIGAQPGPPPAQLPPREVDIPVAEPVREYIPVAEPVVEPTGPPASIIPALPKGTTELVDHGQTQIAILGYHDFSDINPPTEMRMRTSIFRQQMQAIKNSGIPVISMRELIAWKNGERKLPPRCIMITIDDGWKSVYTDAYPVLKEMGFPFTLFLYTNFLTGRGASLSITQVREMMRHGADVGSHSTRHLYPSAWRRSQRSGPESYRKTIEMEIRDSRIWLESNLHVPIQTYCYPGGYHTPEMIESLPESGYKLAFTVIPRKVQYSSSNWEIPRYMVFGNNTQTFTRAVAFGAIAPDSGTAPSNDGGGMVNPSLPAPPQKVEPPANSTVATMLPLISIELADPNDILSDSLEMRVSGFGPVAAKLVEGQPVYQWKPNRPLRNDIVRVRVSWKRASSKAKESAEWEFAVKPETTVNLPANIVR